MPKKKKPTKKAVKKTVKRVVKKKPKVEEVPVISPVTRQGNIPVTGSPNAGKQGGVPVNGSPNQ